MADILIPDNNKRRDMLKQGAMIPLTGSLNIGSIFEEASSKAISAKDFVSSTLNLIKTGLNPVANIEALKSYLTGEQSYITLKIYANLYSKGAFTATELLVEFEKQLNIIIPTRKKLEALEQAYKRSEPERKALDEENKRKEEIQKLNKEIAKQNKLLRTNQRKIDLVTKLGYPSPSLLQARTKELKSKTATLNSKINNKPKPKERRPKPKTNANHSGSLLKALFALPAAVSLSRQMKRYIPFNRGVS